MSIERQGYSGGVNAPEPIIILVTGVMAAGKSTVSQLLAEALPSSVHLRGDTFRRMIVRGRAEPEPELSQAARAQLTLRYRLAASAARGYWQAGFSVVYQDVILEDDLLDVASLLAGTPLHIVVLCPSAQAVSKREAERVKRGYGGGWTVDALQDSLRRTLRLGLWLETSDLTPAQSAEAIWQRLTQARITTLPLP